jgi:hypothetical protein
MDWDTDSRRFSGGVFGDGQRGQGQTARPIHGDAEPFDPTPWLKYPATILWGANHFAARLPVGTWLVWLKKPPERYGTFLSDAELAWFSGGAGVYAKYLQWEGCCRPKWEDDAGFFHPSQKPVALMRWCIQRYPSRDLAVLDPYMGCGTTLIAARDEGRSVVGIEIEERYCEIAAERLSQEVLALEVRDGA